MTYAEAVKQMLSKVDIDDCLSGSEAVELLLKLSLGHR